MESIEKILAWLGKYKDGIGVIFAVILAIWVVFKFFVFESNQKGKLEKLPSDNIPHSQEKKFRKEENNLELKGIDQSIKQENMEGRESEASASSDFNVNGESLGRNLYSKGVMAWDKSNRREGYELVKEALLQEPENIDFLNSAGIMGIELSDFKGSIGYFRKALNIVEKGNEINTYKWAGLCINIANAYLGNGEYDISIEYLRKAWGFFDKYEGGTKKLNLGKVLGNLGNAWAGKNDFNAAIGYYEEALPLLEENLSEGDPILGNHYILMGLAYKGIDEFEIAFQHINKGISLHEKIFPPSHPSLAKDWNNLGTVFESKGMFGDAIQYFQKALDINLKVFGNDSLDVASSYNNLGLALMGKGDFKESKENLENALRIYRKHGHKHYSRKVISNLNKLKEIISQKK